VAAEYWCAQNLVVTVEGPEGRSATTIEKPFARIGGHASSEVVLPHKSVAQRSIYLHATDAGVYCVQLAGPDSEPSEDRGGWLAPDQAIQVGPYRVTVQLADQPPESERPQTDLEATDATLPYPMLLIVYRGRAIANYSLRRRLTIVGRGRRSTLQLADTRVSLTHCILYREEDKLWVVDLLSSNGTSRAGSPLEAAKVEPGDALVLGNVQLVCMRPQEQEIHATDGHAGRRPAAALYDGDRPGQFPPIPLDDSLDDLTRQVTHQMIRFERRARWRRRLITAAVSLLIIAVVAAAAFFLLVGHGVNWRPDTP